jgi:hypothetical protein
MNKFTLGTCFIILCITITGCLKDDFLTEAEIESIGFTANIKKGQKNVPIDSTFAVNFNAAINPNTVTASSMFVVEDKADVIVSEVQSSNIIDNQCLTNTPLTGSITCDPTNLTCTLNLDAPLVSGTAYLLCLMDSIKLSGITLKSFVSDSLSFQTLGAYTIGGAISGLSGSVVLQNNDGDDLELIEDGEFTFATSVDDQKAYKVTLKTRSIGQTCSIGKGSGTLSGENVTNVSITCSEDTYRVGGTISGLTGTVVLQNNDGDDLELTTDGSFTFDTEVANGALYAVTVLTQPTDQACVITSGSGTISAAAVLDVTVTCSAISNDLSLVPDADTVTLTYAIGGIVSDLAGTLVLQNNLGNNLVLTNSGIFSFTTKLAEKAPYSVTILTQPTNQICTVTNGAGMVGAVDITTVSISCVSTLIFAGTSGGLSVSADSGVSFTNNNLGNIRGIFVSRDGTINITGSQGNGLFISTDSGETYINKTTGDPSPIANNDVNGVFASNDGTKIYVATFGGFSISMDSGATWVNKTTGDPSPIINDNVGDVVVSSDGTRIYLATQGGLSISTDSGATWINKNAGDGLGASFVSAVVVSEDGSKIYAATNGGLSISTDSGATWVTKTAADPSPIANNLVFSVTVSNDGSKIYVGTNGGLSISTDSGATWVTKTAADPSPIASNSIYWVEVNDDGLKIFLATAAGLSISTDSGATWVNRSSGDGLGSDTVFEVALP